MDGGDRRQRYQHRERRQGYPAPSCQQALDGLNLRPRDLSNSVARSESWAKYVFVLRTFKADQEIEFNSY
jgi:hypothetical protein